MCILFEPAGEDPLALSLNEVIRQRRKELGLTQAALARRMGAGVSARQIQRMEVSQEWMPSWIRLQQLAIALELPMETFLLKSPDRVDAPQPPLPFVSDQDAIR